MEQNQLNFAMMTAIGMTLIITADNASAAVTFYSWQGYQTILSPDGEAIPDNSITNKVANQYQIPLSGTLAFDHVSGAGTATVEPFFFFGSTGPVQYAGINLQSIGDGAGGDGTLVLANMLFNWNGAYGYPVSIVFDAAGFLGATAAMWGDGVLDQADVAGIAATPASDGTYTNGVYGYLGLGPVPMATTEWNITPAATCGPAPGGCLSVSPSGVLPLAVDNDVNNHEYAQGDGVGIGGVPMPDGPFTGFSFNLDLVTMSFISTDLDAEIHSLLCEHTLQEPDCIGYPSSIPAPATVWLFGSGLLGLIGVARKNRAVKVSNGGNHE